MDQGQNLQTHPKCECHDCTQARALEMRQNQFRPTLDQFMQHHDPVKAQREFLNDRDK